MHIWGAGLLTMFSKICVAVYKAAAVVEGPRPITFGYWSGHASLRRHYATFFVKYFLLSQLRTTHETNTFYFLTTHYAEGLDIHTYFTTQKAFQFEAQFV